MMLMRFPMLLSLLAAAPPQPTEEDRGVTVRLDGPPPPRPDLPDFNHDIHLRYTADRTLLNHTLPVDRPTADPAHREPVNEPLRARERTSVRNTPLTIAERDAEQKRARRRLRNLNLRARTA